MTLLKSILMLATLLFPIYVKAVEEMNITKEQSSPPQHLYKVVSPEDWKASLAKQEVIPSQLDKDSYFLHLATEEQLPSILSKFWKDKDHLVLKLKTQKLCGSLAYETNPGGTNFYYHLYQGSIPLDAVSEVK